MGRETRILFRLDVAPGFRPACAAPSLGSGQALKGGTTRGRLGRSPRLVRALLAWSVISCALVLPGAAPRAEQNPSQDEAEAPKAYRPPSASKSVEVGDYYFKRKKYNAALSRYEEAVKTDPSYAPAYLGLGKVYEKIGLKHKALDSYRKYLEALPSAKQAEEAKDVHRAIARLEQQVENPKSQGASQRRRD